MSIIALFKIILLFFFVFISGSAGAELARKQLAEEWAGDRSILQLTAARLFPFFVTFGVLYAAYQGFTAFLEILGLESYSTIIKRNTLNYAYWIVCIFIVGYVVRTLYSARHQKAAKREIAAELLVGRESAGVSSSRGENRPRIPLNVSPNLDTSRNVISSASRRFSARVFWPSWRFVAGAAVLLVILMSSVTFLVTRTIDEGSPVQSKSESNSPIRQEVPPAPKPSATASTFGENADAKDSKRHVTDASPHDDDINLKPPANLTFASPKAVAIAPEPRPPCSKIPTVLLMIGTRPAGSLSVNEECALKPRTVFKECEKCPEMIAVPAGSFLMGSPDTEEGRYKDEGPQHRVTFSRDFAVGKFAVTNDQWDACVAENACREGPTRDIPKNRFGGGLQPVVEVTWEDTKAFVEWLSRKTGNHYRLPSESEREYVTRAGSTAPFWYGPSITQDDANFDSRPVDPTGNAILHGPAGAVKGQFRERTVLVGSFRSNSWGFYQLHGNVFEWTADCWHDDYTGAPSDGSPWVGSGDCSSRVIRGGSWWSHSRALRSAARGKYPINENDPKRCCLNRDIYIGFRVARAIVR